MTLWLVSELPEVNRPRQMLIPRWFTIDSLMFSILSLATVLTDDHQRVAPMIITHQPELRFNDSIQRGVVLLLSR